MNCQQNLNKVHKQLIFLLKLSTIATIQLQRRAVDILLSFRSKLFIIPFFFYCEKRKRILLLYL